MKRKKKQKKPDFLFITFALEDLPRYSPEHCDSLQEALDLLRYDIEVTASKEGYKTSQVWQESIEDFREVIIETWAEQKRQS